MLRTKLTAYLIRKLLKNGFILKSESERDWNRLLSPDILGQVRLFLLSNLGAELIIIFDHTKGDYAYLKEIQESDLENNEETESKKYTYGQSQLIKSLNTYWQSQNSEIVSIEQNDLFKLVKESTDNGIDLKTYREPLRKLIQLGVVRQQNKTYEILPIIQHIFIQETDFNQSFDDMDEVDSDIDPDVDFDTDNGELNNGKSDGENETQDKKGLLHSIRENLDFKYITAFKALAKGQFIAKHQAGRKVYEYIAKYQTLLKENFAKIGFKVFIPDRLLIDKHRMFQELSTIELMPESDFEQYCRLLSNEEVKDNGEGVLFSQDSLFFNLTEMEVLAILLEHKIIADSLMDGDEIHLKFTLEELLNELKEKGFLSEDDLSVYEDNTKKRYKPVLKRLIELDIIRELEESEKLSNSETYQIQQGIGRYITASFIQEQNKRLRG